MDPNRHHEFMDNNDDRLRTVYLNKEMDGMRFHTQYYAGDRIGSNKLVCGCAPGNSMCNECRFLTPEVSWTETQHIQQPDFGIIDKRTALIQSPLYIHAKNDSMHFWKQQNHSFMESSVIPDKNISAAQIEGYISNKTFALEKNSSYKQPQQIQLQPHLQQHIRTIGDGRCKERSYDNRYSYKQDTDMGGEHKVAFVSSAPSITAVCNVNTHNIPTHIEALRSEKNGPPNVIKTNNSLASKESHLSPNSVRQCPSSLPPEEQNVAHLNLYMETPQFSSDKFATIQPQESRQYDYHRVVNTSRNISHVHLQPESTNLTQNSSRRSSPTHAYSSQSRCNQNTGKLKQFQISQQQNHPRHIPSVGVVSNPTRNIKYSTQNAPNTHMRDISPCVLKKTQTHCQYSKSSVSTPFDATAEFAAYVQKEEAYNNQNVPNQSIYKNPYSAPSFDNCKESSCLIGQNNCHGRSPHGYQKLDKSMIHGTAKTGATEFANQNIPASSRTPYTNQASYYYEKQASNYNNISSASSPRAGLTASSSSLVAPNKKEYASQRYTHLPDYPQQQYHGETSHSSIQINDVPLIQNSDNLYELNERPKVICSNTSNLEPLNGQTPSLQSTPHQSAVQITKKSQAPKPNYRELIYAMRNATNEEELNLKIIKKTLNVDHQVIRSVAAPVVNISASIAQPPSSIANNQSKLLVPTGHLRMTPLTQVSFLRDTYTAESFPIASQCSVINAPTKEIQDGTRNILRFEEKLSASPLDLSMRTVKTKADSTECKNRPFIPTNSQNVECKSALPKVDFSPNFSLQTTDRDLIAKSIEESDISRRLGNVSFSQRTGPPSTEFKHNAPTAYSGLYNQPHKESSRKDNSTETSPARVHTLYDSSRNKAPSPASRTEQHITLKSQVIKSSVQSTIARHDADVPLIRRSVVETNPYAIVRVLQPEIERKIITVDKFASDTNIMPSIKDSLNTFSVPLIEIARPVDQSHFLVENPHGQLYGQNANISGRKRHLQDYPNEKHSGIVTKQFRYSEAPSQGNKIYPTEVSNISVNDRAPKIESLRTVEKSMQADVQIPCYHQKNSVQIINNDVKDICKKEPITPAVDVSPSSMPIASVKTEAIAARIRTKAELKGFTFNPPSIVDGSSTNGIPKIKEERSFENQTPNIEQQFIPGLTEEFNQWSHLDTSWNNACNNFVEQLIKRQSIKKTNIIIKSEIVVGDTPVAKVDLKKDESRENLSDIESAEGDVSFDIIETNDSVMTVISTIQDITRRQTVIQKKTCKLDREKLRLQQEQRIAARLQDVSSSETDNELNKRKNQRFKKPLKKGKVRANKMLKNLFSDCGSDTSSESEQNDSLANSHVKQQQRKEKANSVFNATSRKHFRKQKRLVDSIKSENENSSKNCTEVVNSNTKTYVNRQINCKSKDETVYRDQKKDNAVQYTVCSSQYNLDKPTKKLKHCSKTGLNTMTRSKRKRELELQLANSKVLRNDKVIRNSTTKIKRKYVRKFANNKKPTCIEPSNKEAENEVINTRLRSKNDEDTVSVKRNTMPSRKETACKMIKNRNENVKEHKLASIKGTEKQTDFFMEVYRYKRSLKIPPSLITIKHPSNHKIAASLPDLERDISYDIPPFDSHCLTALKTVKDNIEQTKSPIYSAEPKSIIDVLHSRVLSSSAVRSQSKISKSIINCSNVNVHTQVGLNIMDNAVSDLLKIPKKDDSEVEKKRHFSIFETKILKTKTRTESKLQQKREIIREIFVGNDRPASAPPEMTQISDGGERMTYEQKYEQFLQQINEDSLRNFGRATKLSISSSPSLLVVRHAPATVKQEKDAEGFIAIDVEENTDSNNRNVVSRIFPTPNRCRRRRPGKYVRRKGSSGFDYIRKKKKPTALPTVVSQNLTLLAKSHKIEDGCALKMKTEGDVCREIQKWVLNKGVGQSTMHKAARLGYIDVIVYCLDRIGMNPDQKDNAGYTPLHEACTNGWIEIARVLLQYGANHSEAAHSGIRPLHEASENDHEEIVRLLLSYGADPMLATYSGQTPLMLASSIAMRDILNNHLSDVQNCEPDGKQWRFNGPWEIFDATECGYDVLGSVPNFTCDMSRALRKSSISTLITNKKPLINQLQEMSCKTVMDKCAVVLDNIDRFNSIRLYNDNKPEFLVENSDSDGEIFEFEEADVLLPPLYLLKDEGTDKWVLLSDLCNLLKVKSKDTLLNKICSSSSLSSTHKSLMRELKMSDFLEKATCLQLLCAGEKINICASKVVLIKYNESVRNLLGVKTILMKF